MTSIDPIHVAVSPGNALKQHEVIHSLSLVKLLELCVGRVNFCEQSFAVDHAHTFVTLALIRIVYPFVRRDASLKLCKDVLQ